jgi:hypothetical protein
MRMSLGIALVVVFVLYLVDKHDRWRQAFKGAVWLGLLCAVLLDCIYGWTALNDYRTRKAYEKAEQRDAAPAFDPSAPYSEASPTGTARPIWIYVDAAQEFDGYFSTRPRVPSQIAAMIKKDEDCVPGSNTYGDDNVEWVCVQPSTIPAGAPSGAVIEPIKR